jgi:hypothetical protein
VVRILLVFRACSYKILSRLFFEAGPVEPLSFGRYLGPGKTKGSLIIMVTANNRSESAYLGQEININSGVDGSHGVNYRPLNPNRFELRLEQPASQAGPGQSGLNGLIRDEHGRLVQKMMARDTFLPSPSANQH